MDINIGIICPSEIAFRRFLPAIHKPFVYAGVGVPRSDEWESDNFDTVHTSEYNKALEFQKKYGGKIYDGYSSVISDPDISAVYIPLPPALHCKYALKAIEAGKHVLVEKPCTPFYCDTKKLVSEAVKRGVVLHENYAFIYHSQIDYFKKIITSGEIGDVRLIRLDFGYPFRGEQDFRYYKNLGGGSFLDIGGYPLIFAMDLLGSTAELKYSRLNYDAGFDADISGSAALMNEHGLTAQIGFGSFNEYRCSIDIWGSKASVFSGRVFSAPNGFEPEVTITEKGEKRTVKLPADDSFARSLDVFADKINGAPLCYENLLAHSLIFDSILYKKEL